VDGAQNEVAGQGRLNSDLGRLKVSNLSHHDDIGILPEKGTEGRSKGEADFLMHLHLIDSHEVIFNRVFGGDIIRLFVRSKRRVGRRFPAVGPVTKVIPTGFLMAAFRS
jgi:hypothetical protein